MDTNQSSPESDLVDARDRPIIVNTDWLLTDRGLVYRPLPTPPTYQQQGMVRAQLFHNGQPKGDTIFLQCSLVFFTDTLFPNAQGNISLWRSLYEQYVRPRRRAELRARKTGISREYPS